MALGLSALDGIQSRFIGAFDKHAIDVIHSNEHYSGQGVAVDMNCDGVRTIFDQVKTFRHLSILSKCFAIYYIIYLVQYIYKPKQLIGKQNYSTE